MTSMLNRAGRVYLSVDGQRVDVTSGGIRYGFGVVKLTEIVGADNLHGFAGEPQPAFIEFSVTDHQKMDLVPFLQAQDVTVTAELFNGKTLVLSMASNCGEPVGQSSDGAITIRYVGTSLKELPA